MKKLCLAAGLMVMIGACFPGMIAADAVVVSVSTDLPPEFRGLLVLGEECLFNLTTPGGTQSGWAGVGGSFDDWEIISYREADQVLVLRKGDVTADVTLATARIIEDETAHSVRVAQAEALIKQMNFEAMFSRLIDQQKKVAASMMRQMVPNGAVAHLGPEELAFQERVFDVMWAEMNPEQMGADMAKAYAEVFTPTELRGMAEFYSTPAGRATIDKQPELQQRLMQSMMPRIMGALPKIQQMGQEFEAARRAKAEQQIDAGNATPSEIPPASAEH